MHQGKRLFIDLEGVSDPKVYEITNINRTTNMYGGYGFFDITCVEDVMREGDRPDLMIADYIEEKEPPTPPIGLCEIAYSGDCSIKVGGSPKTFTAVFKDSYGDIIDVMTPTWTIIADVEVEDKIEVLSQIDNQIKLEIKDESVIGKDFNLKLWARDSVYGTFECILPVAVKSVF